MTGPSHMREAEVVAIARRVADDQGWTWLPPVEARLANGVWEVRSNAHARGCNVVIQIDDATGELRSKSFAPR